MISIRIEPGFGGPTLSEIASLLDDHPVSENDEPIEIRWSNRAEEAAMLQRFRTLPITLVVETHDEMERAATQVGARLNFDPEMERKASISIKNSAEWRALVRLYGPYATRSLLVGMMTQSLYHGGRAHTLRAVLYECLFEGVSPADIETLVRLRSLFS